MSKSVECRAKPEPSRGHRTAVAPKRLSCPVGVQVQAPFFHQSHTGLHELGTDFYQFTELMKTGSRQPIICNDIIGTVQIWRPVSTDSWRTEDEEERREEGPVNTSPALPACV
ncbi:hypothetical protein AAFF_G00355610 [Aldrovandia affinis]|uniref:Uncharacterized protein n=1 Tax=Aldrovandia affinis TaxID=143900 RepID=A0AAD7R555_9TELE|nr:hypothetical protein AAFF_G00355610 [Aldrovandia affinis]